MAAVTEAVPSEAIRQPQPARAAAPEEVSQHGALRGNTGGGRQNDGGVPRAAGHRAVHPGHHEYCKCYNHIADLGGPQVLTRSAAGRNKSWFSPQTSGFGRGCHVLFLQGHKQGGGNAVGKADLFQGGSSFSPSPERDIWVKNPGVLLLHLSNDTLGMQGLLCRRCAAGEGNSGHSDHAPGQI